MKSRARVIDTFQIVGFVVSTGTAIGLMLANVDGIQSTGIGLMLAILTQLFDLQLRHSTTEDRVLQANALSRALYRDAPLLNKFSQMVEDYYSIKEGWFDLFKLRAEDAVSECHSVLRSMSAGMMETPPRSDFAFTVASFRYAKSSLKQVVDWAGLRGAVEGIRHWYTESVSQLAPRGVQITTVLVVSREDLHYFASQSGQGVPMPGEYYVALSDELPQVLDENYIIMDDRAVGFIERRADGQLADRSVSIVPVEVERMVKRFDQVLRYARKMEDVVASLSAPEQAVSAEARG